MIPKKWEVGTIEKGVKLLSGQHIESSFYNEDGLGVAYLTGPADFYNKKINVTKYTEHPKVMCQKEDILITVKGSGTGKSVLADGKYCISRQLMAIRPKSMDVEFIYFVIQSNEERYATMSAGLIPGITREDVLKTPLLIPPLPEQRKIAEILSTWDDAIESLEQLITAKRKLKQGLMQQLLTGKKRFKEFEGSEWKEYLQGKVARFYNGRAYKLSEWEETGTPVIRLQNLTGRGNDFYYSNLELSEHQYVNYGDLLYMWSATFGAHIWKGEKAIYHYHIWKIECDSNLLNKRLFYYLLDFETAQRMSKSNGMGILHITKATMESTKIKLPSLKEQEQIASTLSVTDTEISILKTQLTAYKLQKRGLMQQLLTGKKRVKILAETTT